jgi:hypothetical protein
VRPSRDHEDMFLKRDGEKEFAGHEIIRNDNKELNATTISSIEKSNIKSMSHEERQGVISHAMRTILEALGEDPDREGLQKTPDRFAKALLFFTQGYTASLTGWYSSVSLGPRQTYIQFVHGFLL